MAVKKAKKITKKKATKKLEPPWMKFARSRIGVKEKPGKGSNKEILGWAAVIGGKVFRYFTTDSIAWCGLLVAISFTEKGIAPVKDPLWARNWAKFGKDLQKVGPCYGAVMVFKRGSGGHVGFYVSEDSSYYHILGGNQSDKVNIAKVAKSRCIAWRWPKGVQYNKFYKPGRIKKKFDGKVSRNEA